MEKEYIYVFVVKNLNHKNHYQLIWLVVKNTIYNEMAI